MTEKSLVADINTLPENGHFLCTNEIKNELVEVIEIQKPRRVPCTCPNCTNPQNGYVLLALNLKKILSKVYINRAT